MKHAIAGLTLGVVMALPALSDEARVAEVDEFATGILETHPEGHIVGATDRWQSALVALMAVAETGGEESYLTALMRLLATFHDGHTTVPVGYNLGQGHYPQRLPLRFRAFDGGLYVVSAKDEALPLLGGRVTAIAGRDIGEVLEDFVQMWPANNEAYAYVDAGLLGLPVFMAGLGLSESEEASFSITVETPGGELVTATLHPRRDATQNRIDLERAPSQVEAWATNGPNFVQRLESERALYVSIGTIGDTDALSFAALTDQLEMAVLEPGFDRLIIDLRNNGGGDNTMSERLRRVVTLSQYNTPGRLYILTSPSTFSAAVNTAGRFERDTFAIFIGEPTGAGPNHFGDADLIKGSHSNVGIIVSTLRWQDSVPFDERVWIMPDVYVPRTYEDWIAGHDAGLAAALVHETELSEDDPQWFSMWARPSQAEIWVPFWRR